ncbi:DUF6053 domain-containing protein [Lysobacter yananisis]
MRSAGRELSRIDRAGAESVGPEGPPTRAKAARKPKP